MYGEELANASKNIKNFNIEQDANNISSRYYDFITILIATLIVKRFQKQLHPLTTEEISINYKIPSKLSAQIISKLSDVGVICEVVTDDEIVHSWQPAVAIHLITVGLVMNRLDRHGSEEVKIDNEYLFSKEWNALLDAKIRQTEIANNIKLMDLQE